MERILEQGEIYSEKILSQLVERATDEIEPGIGYSLKLEGIRANLLTIKEIEAHFGTNIDTRSDTTLHFSYDESSQALNADQLTMKLIGVTGSASLKRTKNGSFIPILEVANKPFQKSNMVTSEQMNRWIEGFGISQSPAVNSAEFQGWKAHILGNTKAWHLSEKTEIPIAFNEQAVQSTILRHDTVVGSGNMDLRSLRTVTWRIDQIAHDDTTLRSEEALELYAEGADQTLRSYLFNGTLDIDPFVHDDVTINDSRFEAKAITPDTYPFLIAKLQKILSEKKMARSMPEQL